MGSVMTSMVQNRPQNFGQKEEAQSSDEEDDLDKIPQFAANEDEGFNFQRENSKTVREKRPMLGAD